MNIIPTGGSVRNSTDLFKSNLLADLRERLKAKHIAAAPPPNPTPARVSNEAFWRKQLILRRGVLEVQWRQAFPQHDFRTVRLTRPPLAWDDDWRAAARLYHTYRNRNSRAD